MSDQRLFFYCNVCRELYVGGTMEGMVTGKACDCGVQGTIKLVGYRCAKGKFMRAHNVLWAAYALGGPSAAAAVWATLTPPSRPRLAPELDP